MLLDIDTVENVEIELILFLSQYLSIKSLDDNKKNLIKLRLYFRKSQFSKRSHNVFKRQLAQHQCPDVSVFRVLMMDECWDVGFSLETGLIG